MARKGLGRYTSWVDQMTDNDHLIDMDTKHVRQHTSWVPRENDSLFTNAVNWEYAENSSAMLTSICFLSLCPFRDKFLFAQ
jgi:hypothetical protein